MKFILFVEGDTEQKSLPSFLKRWLDDRLEHRVGIQIVKFNGWPDFIKNAPTKARMYLNSTRSDDIIAIIGLLDLYGPTFYPTEMEAVSDRYQWAKRYVEELVDEAKYRQFFSVHEVEAWLLSNPDIFPQVIKNSFPKRVLKPETINFDEPPKRLLQRLYKEKAKCTYKEVTYGNELFSKLDPAISYEKCPSLKALLDEMFKLAKEAGL